jgi:hypothetical protein
MFLLGFVQLSKGKLNSVQGFDCQWGDGMEDFVDPDFDNHVLM